MSSLWSGPLNARTCSACSFYCCLRPLRRKMLLAFATGADVSAFRRLCSLVATGRRGSIFDSYHNLGHHPAPPAIFHRGLVLVPGDLGANDRTPAGWSSEYGGSLCLSSFCWVI